jgi:AcrR family transcriptional regulator
MDEQTSKGRILDAAVKEFAAHGLEGARVDRIAATAGVNKAMLYYHFSSKDNLYRQVLEEKLGELAKRVDLIVDKADSLENVLESLSQLYASMFRDNPEIRSLALRELASGGDRLRDTFAQVLHPIDLPRRLKRLLDAGKREGKYRELDGRQALISFIGMNLFYPMMAPLIDSIWEIKNEKRFRQERPPEVVDLFLHGLLAR